MVGLLRRDHQTAWTPSQKQGEGGWGGEGGMERAAAAYADCQRGVDYGAAPYDCDGCRACHTYHLHTAALDSGAAQKRTRGHDHGLERCRCSTDLHTLAHSEAALLVAVLEFGGPSEVVPVTPSAPKAGAWGFCRGFKSRWRDRHSALLRYHKRRRHVAGLD